MFISIFKIIKSIIIVSLQKINISAFVMYNNPLKALLWMKNLHVSIITRELAVTLKTKLLIFWWYFDTCIDSLWHLFWKIDRFMKVSVLNYL